MKNKYLRAGSVAGATLILDQLTKLLVIRHIALHETIPVIPGFFNLVHVRNRGAAFSLLSNMPGAFRTLFFVGVTVIALAVIGAIIRKTGEMLQIFSLSLIAGGAAGNLIDRVRYGEVVDFVQLYIWKKFAFLHPWPSFNVADSAITVGVALLAVDMLFGKHKEERVES